MADQPGTEIVTAAEAAKDKKLARYTTYFKREDVIEHFQAVIGEHNARAYVGSVLLAVMENPDLQECTPMSIFSAAFRAATLRLWVDPTLRQAYIAPFGSKEGRNHATLIVSYKGLQDMAVRTNKYSFVPWSCHVRQGFKAVQAIPSGFWTIVRDETEEIDETKTKGYIAYAELRLDPKSTNRVPLSFYMSVEQIHEHAKTWNPNGYAKKDGAWQKNALSREAMEMKTVLRQLLLHKAYLDPADVFVMTNAEEVEAPEDSAPPEQEPDTGLIISQGAVDAASAGPEKSLGSATPEDLKPARTRQQSLDELGFKGM